MSKKLDHFLEEETWATPKHVECALAHLLISKIRIRIMYFISTLKSNFKSRNPKGCPRKEVSISSMAEGKAS